MPAHPTFFRHIVHPTDFTQMSEAAFFHALQLARLAQSRLSLIHVSQEHEALEWTEFPGVRATLERWGLLSPGSKRRDVGALGIEVDKIFARGRDILATLLDYVDRHDGDLVVLGTHQYDGLERVVHETIAEPLARRACVPCLFVPQQAPGFVSPSDGAISLRHLIVPSGGDVEPQIGVERAVQVAKLSPATAVTFSLFHVGSKQTMPLIQPVIEERWEWREEFGQGDPEGSIVEFAHRSGADLIVMASAGHRSLGDMLLGSTTERVVRHSPCPVLMVPV